MPLMILRRKGMQMIKGIDVSRWQGNIDFNKVKASGVNFCIVKAGGSDAGFYTDSKFKTNVQNALAAGLHVGAYYFVGPLCNSAEAGALDAYRFHQIIKDYPLDYPVYIDFEAPKGTNKQGNTDACYAFCEYMEHVGYYAGIYASDVSGFKDRLIPEQLVRFDKWVAKYSTYEPKVIPKWGIWQYSSKGNVPGINGHVDMNWSRNDYDAIIKQKHLNGF